MKLLVAPVLAIIAGGAIGGLLTLSPLVLRAPSDDVPDPAPFVAPSAPTSMEDELDAAPVATIPVLYTPDISETPEVHGDFSGLVPPQVPPDTTMERYLALIARALQNERASLLSQAAQTLGSMKSTLAIPALEIALRDEDAGVRGQAACALGEIESTDAIPALEIALRDEDAGVRQQAAWALGRIGDREAAEALVEALEDESEDVVREAAMWALGRVRR